MSKAANWILMKFGGLTDKIIAFYDYKIVNNIFNILN